MAHYFIFPQQDANIHSHPSRVNQNTGIDEILTIGDELYSGYYYPIRSLIQFKDNDIINVIDNIAVDSPIKAELKLFQSEHRNLNTTQHIELYPLAQSWLNGTGRTSNNPISTNGASWNHSDNDLIKSKWVILPNTTSSYSGSLAGGGVWYTGSEFQVTKSLAYGDDFDINLDVTNIVKKYYSSSKFSTPYPNGIPNHGFILKKSGSQEYTQYPSGDLNFFSVDTHTIYPPYLDISWDDSSYITGSGDVLASGDLYVTMRNNAGTYRQGEEIKFRLNVRELYPTRKFVTSSNYLDVNYFTSESYYSLVDYATEEVIIPFDEYTKLSADSEGMYFKLYMNGLQAERYYRVLIKHYNNDGVKIYDEDFYFKVIK